MNVGCTYFGMFVFLPWIYCLICEVNEQKKELSKLEAMLREMERRKDAKRPRGFSKEITGKISNKGKPGFKPYLYELILSCTDCCTIMILLSSLCIPYIPNSIQHDIRRFRASDIFIFVLEKLSPFGVQLNLFDIRYAWD